MKKLKILEYPNGSIVTSEFIDNFSSGANVQEETGMTINGQKPINEDIIEAPDDFYKNNHLYKLEKKGKKYGVSPKKKP